MTSRPATMNPPWNLILTLTAVGIAMAGCSSSNSTTPAASATGTAPAIANSAPSPSVEPRTYDAVKAAVDKIDAAAKAHDGGTCWDILIIRWTRGTPDGQAGPTLIRGLQRPAYVASTPADTNDRLLHPVLLD